LPDLLGVIPFTGHPKVLVVDISCWISSVSDRALEEKLPAILLLPAQYYQEWRLFEPLKTTMAASEKAAA
jgi:hypothetical protein